MNQPIFNTTKIGIFDCFASCPRGMEALLENELDNLGASEPKAVNGGCYFKAGLPLAIRITYWTRFAGRVGIKIGQAPCRSDEDLYKLAKSLDWYNWFGLNQTFRVDLTLLGARFPNPRLAQLRIKDGVCDAFVAKTNQRPDVSVDSPDIRIFAAATPTQAKIYLDLAGENLFKRGWRLDKGEAPLKENLAAGIWHTVSNSPMATGINQFLDPFCGSGTLVIESLSALCDRAPGIDRSFAFENLKPYDPALGDAIQKQANERFNIGLDNALASRPFQWKASDITPLLTEMAQSNAERAGFGELMDAGMVAFSQRDALTTKPWAEKGFIISNPPYGERVRAKGAEIEDEDEAYLRLFKQYGDLLKQSFTGWNAFLLSGDLDIRKHIGLTPRRKTPFFNGAIECRLFEFPMTQGVYRPRGNELPQ